MPSTLAQFRARIAARLVDASNAVWSTTTIDEALLTALHDYSEAYPYSYNQVLVLTAASREINLDTITGLINVTEAHWPYNSLAEEWPPNRVRGFQVYWDDARPMLYLTDIEGNQPQIDEEIRVWWTGLHTIQALESATATTIRADHESGIVTGAAGYAAASAVIDEIGSIRVDKAEDGSLRGWAYNRLSEFRRWLDTLRQLSPSYAPTFHAGWKLDKWDSRT
jgi:hypothetical protein